MRELYSWLILILSSTCVWLSADKLLILNVKKNWLLKVLYSDAATNSADTDDTVSVSYVY